MATVIAGTVSAAVVTHGGGDGVAAATSSGPVTIALAGDVHGGDGSGAAPRAGLPSIGGALAAGARVGEEAGAAGRPGGRGAEAGVRRRGLRALGRELDPCPLPRQQELARAPVDAGADAVVGGHAHVLLGGGYLGDSYVDDGLGNFVFNTRNGEGSRSGLLTLTVYGGERAAPRPVSAAQAGRGYLRPNRLTVALATVGRAITVQRLSSACAPV